MKLQAKKYFNVLHLNEELSDPGLQTLRLIEIEYDSMVEAIQIYEQTMDRMETQLNDYLLEALRARANNNLIN